MPKSSPTLSPSNNNPHSKPSSDDPTSRMSDVALRKKKNADAQAAFRARRANYIATLEETGSLHHSSSPNHGDLTEARPVTSLESVVLQLQDSCRESRNESQELRQEMTRLRHEFREREKLWRALWQARKTGQGPEPDDLPPLPPSFSSTGHSQPGGLASHMGSSHLQQYGNEAMGYRTNDDASICNGAYNAGPGPSHGYQNHSPSMPYAGVETDVDSSSHSLNHHRVQKYSPYPYPVRDGPWPQSIAQSSSSGAESGAPTSNHSSHSPGYVESPTLTGSDMSYVGRFPVEDQKVSLETAPYVFPNSRSLSPTTSTPGSSSSTSLTSSFQFTFPDTSVGPDRQEYDYRRHHGPEVTLHGGTADISLPGPANDAVRYRLGPRRANSGPDRPLLPALPPLSGSDNGSQHERGSSDGDSTPYARLRPRRGNVPSRSSRSPSPGAPPLSGTLAVIKAQAFGALRRTRARTKKSSEGAAKVAMDVLEARGIGMGVSAGSKRPRLDSDDIDMQQS